MSAQPNPEHGPEPVADARADVEVLDAPMGGISHSQEKAIIALLAEPTIARAASNAGVGERTLHRWMREPRFPQYVVSKWIGHRSW